MASFSHHYELGMSCRRRRKNGRVNNFMCDGRNGNNDISHIAFHNMPSLLSALAIREMNTNLHNAMMEKVE